jgi:transposase InsO family protein
VEFFHHIHCKYTGIRGFVTLYNHALKYQYMIKEEAKKRAAILAFWQKHGLQATMDAYGVSRSTLFLWKQKIKKGNGKLESLNNGSRAPKNRRRRIIPPHIKSFIVEQRKLCPRLGKEKINELLRQKNIANLSDSTIGRMIADLKQKGELPKRIQVSMYARTGNIVEKTKKKRKKLRRKGYKPEKAGDLLQLDTIEKFINGIKRYVVSAIDLESDFGFAYAYTSANSKNTRDFFEKLQEVSPFKIKRIQTDNGSEFEKYFRVYVEQNKITHFHNYPHHPQSNGHVERFNRTLQEEFINYHKSEWAYSINKFNHKLINYLLSPVVQYRKTSLVS